MVNLLEQYGESLNSVSQPKVPHLKQLKKTHGELQNIFNQIHKIIKTHPEEDSTSLQEISLLKEKLNKIKAQTDQNDLLEITKNLYKTLSSLKDWLGFQKQYFSNSEQLYKSLETIPPSVDSYLHGWSSTSFNGILESTLLLKKILELSDFKLGKNNLFNSELIKQIDNDVNAVSWVCSRWFNDLTSCFNNFFVVSEKLWLAAERKLSESDTNPTLETYSDMILLAEQLLSIESSLKNFQIEVKKFPEFKFLALLLQRQLTTMEAGTEEYTSKKNIKRNFEHFDSMFTQMEVEFPVRLDLVKKLIDKLNIHKKIPDILQKLGQFDFKPAIQKIFKEYEYSDINHYITAKAQLKCILSLPNSEKLYPEVHDFCFKEESRLSKDYPFNFDELLLAHLMKKGQLKRGIVSNFFQSLIPDPSCWSERTKYWVRVAGLGFQLIEQISQMQEKPHLKSQLNSQRLTLEQEEIINTETAYLGKIIKEKFNVLIQDPQIINTLTRKAPELKPVLEQIIACYSSTPDYHIIMNSYRAYRQENMLSGKTSQFVDWITEMPSQYSIKSISTAQSNEKSHTSTSLAETEKVISSSKISEFFYAGLALNETTKQEKEEYDPSLIDELNHYHKQLTHKPHFADILFDGNQSPIKEIFSEWKIFLLKLESIAEKTIKNGGVELTKWDIAKFKETLLAMREMNLLPFCLSVLFNNYNKEKNPIEIVNSITLLIPFPNAPYNKELIAIQKEITHLHNVLEKIDSYDSLQKAMEKLNLISNNLSFNKLNDLNGRYSPLSLVAFFQTVKDFADLHHHAMTLLKNSSEIHNEHIRIHKFKEMLDHYLAWQKELPSSTLLPTQAFAFQHYDKGLKLLPSISILPELAFASQHYLDQLKSIYENLPFYDKNKEIHNDQEPSLIGKSSLFVSPVPQTLDETYNLIYENVLLSVSILNGLFFLEEINNFLPLHLKKILEIVPPLVGFNIDKNMIQLYSLENNEERIKKIHIKYERSTDQTWVKWYEKFSKEDETDGAKDVFKIMNVTGCISELKLSPYEIKSNINFTSIENNEDLIKKCDNITQLAYFLENEKLKTDIGRDIITQYIEFHDLLENPKLFLNLIMQSSRKIFKPLIKAIKNPNKEIDTTDLTEKYQSIIHKVIQHCKDECIEDLLINAMKLTPNQPLYNDILIAIKNHVLKNMPEKIAQEAMSNSLNSRSSISLLDFLVSLEFNIEDFMEAESIVLDTLKNLKTNPIENNDQMFEKLKDSLNQTITTKANSFDINNLFKIMDVLEFLGLLYIFIKVLDNYLGIEQNH